MWTYNYTDELYHYGVKGMKWGVRRYQNEDGSLTSKGKKRYERDSREKEFNKYDESSGTYYKQSKKNGRTDNIVDANRYVKEDLQRNKSLADASVNAARKLKEINDKAIKDTSKTQMDLSNMTDKEMREQINRALLEKQYNDMFTPKKVSKGRVYVNRLLEVGIDVLGVTGSALSIALAIRELRGR